MSTDSINNNNTYNSKDLINKEAKGTDDFDLGEIKEVLDEFVITEKGIIDKDRFYIPKKTILHIDGHYVWFKLTKKEAKQYQKQ
jgi:hypothetical protein